METAILSALAPVILLLALGVLAAIATRMMRLSSIVGYLAIGIALSATGAVKLTEPLSLLAELGVVLLLFDIGLHFSISHLRERATDIFGMGSAQVVLASTGLGVIGLAFGLPPMAAFVVGATLSLSSTAVVVRIIVERHQQGCPVGITTTSILVFQDVAAIFILIFVTALDSGRAVGLEVVLALAKAIGAFAVAVVSARYLVLPLFELVARNRNEEMFTAVALLIALAAGWATGSVGLSLTLGAFLGGMMVSETPYRAIIQSEIKPFRGLLLGFFFISVGLPLDFTALARLWPEILVVAAIIVGAKIVLNIGASLLFRWSVPGSTQLGFLLAQGSEFAFVILSLPSVRALVGESRSSVLIAAVALTLAVAPNLAEAGRAMAGRLRRIRSARAQFELIPHDLVEPVLVVGMGDRGRTIADALNAFGIGYAAIEENPRLLREAVADGYNVIFGSLSDPRIWDPVAMGGRRLSVLTKPSLDLTAGLSPIAQRFFPDLTSIAVVGGADEAEAFAAIGLPPVIDNAEPHGLQAAMAVLDRLGISPGDVEGWVERQKRGAVEHADVLAPL
ncbi:cation:proton antiporter [Sphingomonas sp. NFR15]|uniref:cation:proton antiporter domain-containing protein n=1 Tax=Sphingomonas sp. NFR15 TaxID=1566282 RepID=UPI00088B4F1A|nr:cation:proton antiporter [Sphingomonas sp. NFR15]SDA35874.1 Kef-type potassium/proton antiporter, CPA2 family [Sphingomonas sp. NFR15]